MSVNALFGIAVNTASTINGRTPNSAINGQALASAFNITAIDFVFIPTDADGTLLTTARWSSYKVFETGYDPGVMAYVNGVNHGGIPPTSSPMDHHEVYDDLVTPAWLQLSCDGNTYSDIDKWIRGDLAARTPSDAAWETIQETTPMPVIGTAVSFAAMLRFGMTGSGAAGCNWDTINASSTSFAVIQYQTTTNDPTGPGALYAHGDGGGFGGVGAGQAVTSKAAPRWCSLLQDTPNDMVGMVMQDGATGAYMGSSMVSSNVSAPTVFTGVGDYLDANGGTQDCAWVCCSGSGKFPMDDNFVLPAVTALAISQLLADEFLLTWVGVGNGGAASLDRYRVRRQVNGGGFSTLEAALTTRYYNDTTGGIADGDLVEYEVTALLNLTAHESDPATVSDTVDNTKGPLATNLHAYYPGDGIVGLANGAGVAVWPDYSGNGFDLVQAGVSQQPNYVTGLLNGLPGVQTNGTTDYMTATLTGLGSARTGLIVAAKTTAADGNYRCCAGFNNNGAILLFANTGVFASGSIYNVNQANAAVSIGGTPTDFNVWGYNYASQASLAVTRDSTAVSTFDPNNNYDVVDFVIGDNIPGNLPGDYKILEILWWNASLSGGEMTTEIDRLRTKYAL